MAPWEGSNALVWDAERLRTATDAAGVALWSWNVDTDEIALDERAHRLWGVPRRNRPVTFGDLSTRIHPEDLGRVKGAFQATRAVPGAYEIDFRVCHDDGLRWLSARGRGGDLGLAGRAMLGVFLDVTGRKRAEEAHELLAGEMGHRVKNLFAIASALTAIAARSAATTTEMARDLTQRLTALGRAHDLVRPVPGQAEGKAALLGDLLTTLLAPYDAAGAAGERISVSVPEVRVGDAAVTALALVVHELATNSVKYGALSAASGRLDVSCPADDAEVALTWAEWGVSAVLETPALHSADRQPSHACVLALGFSAFASLSDAEGDLLRDLAGATRYHPPYRDLHAAEAPPPPRMIVAGWAAQYRQLADGQRQIVSLRLPGDFVAPLGQLRFSSTCAVAALTELETVDAQPLTDAGPSRPGPCRPRHGALGGHAFGRPDRAPRLADRRRAVYPPDAGAARAPEPRRLGAGRPLCHAPNAACARRRAWLQRRPRQPHPPATAPRPPAGRAERHSGADAARPPAGAGGLDAAGRACHPALPRPCGTRASGSVGCPRRRGAIDHRLMK